MAVKGRISGLEIQALREIGEGNATSEQIRIISEQLRQESLETVRHDAALAPAWIREIMLAAISKSVHPSEGVIQTVVEYLLHD